MPQMQLAITLHEGQLNPTTYFYKAGVGPDSLNELELDLGVLFRAAVRSRQDASVGQFVDK